MSRNGSGVYSKPAGTTAVSGATIESAKFNELMNDIAGDLNLARPVVAGGTGASTPAAARTNLGVTIGTDVQGYDAGLASIAGLTVAADQGVYATGADTYATFALGSLSRTFLANTTAAGYRSTLGLGTNATLNFADLINTPAEWEAGTATDYGYITPAQLKAAVLAQTPVFAEAYVTYSGTTPTMVAEYGMATASRPAVGDTAFTFDTAQPDTNYTIETHIQNGLGSSDHRYQSWVLAKSTTGFTVRWRFTTLAANDLVDFSVTCKRLA